MPGYLLLFTLASPIIWIAINSANASSACGSYEKLDVNKTLNLTSPNYPNFSLPSTLCIWLIEAPANFSVTLTINEFLSQTNSPANSCAEQLVVCNDNRTGDVVWDFCVNGSTSSVSSSFRSMWISYSAKYFSTAARFSGTVSTFYNPSNATYNTPRCNQTDFQCPNYQCVSLSYICDNVNDCGCTGSYCDEGDYYCTTSGFVNVMTLNYTFSVALGIVLFTSIFLGTALCDAKCCEPLRKKCRREVKSADQTIPVNMALKRMVSNFAALNHTSETPSRRSSQYMTASGSISASTANSLHKKISVSSYADDSPNSATRPLAVEEPSPDTKTSNIPKYGSTLLPSDIPSYKPSKV